MDEICKGIRRVGRTGIWVGEEDGSGSECGRGLYTKVGRAMKAREAAVRESCGGR